MSNIVGDVEGVPQTFSSWDNCMSEAYCKYPAIIGIVIASLIVLSIVWCFTRCLCCGASCCCACFRCCGCLESCTRPRGSNAKDSRYKDEYAPVQNQQPMPYQGYQTPSMMYGAAPQFATFDASSRRTEDSLPAMPSWDTAHTRRIEDDTQDMEMKHLEYQASGGQPLSRNPNAYAPVANAPISPIHSPYHEQHDPYASNPSPYTSDPHQAPFSHDLSPNNYSRAPLSPAPTYTSQPQRPSMNTTSPSFASDRYAAPQQQWSPVASTRYEPTEYTSPLQQQRPPSFQSFAQSPSQGQRGSYQAPAGQARPPSFLQVGRKPVGGSVREL